MTGSNLPSCANWLMSRPNESRAGVCEAPGFSAAFAFGAFASAANARFFGALTAFAAATARTRSVGAKIFHDLRARLFQVESQTAQHRRGQTIFFAQKRQQKMFGADVVMAHPTGFVGGEFQDALGFGL